jgi:hypothetical protein
MICWFFWQKCIRSLRKLDLAAKRRFFANFLAKQLFHSSVNKNECLEMEQNAITVFPRPYPQDWIANNGYFFKNDWLLLAKAIQNTQILRDEIQRSANPEVRTDFFFQKVIGRS